MARMDSREAGLLLAQQLFQVDDLHYGWWNAGDQITLANLPAAQAQYNSVLVECVAGHAQSGRVLDIGCGTGKLLSMLLQLGYEAEGVVPSATLHRMVMERLARQGQRGTTVFECRFEDFPAPERSAAYDVAIFSESFQYIPIDQSLKMLGRVMRPRGLVVVCDFFRSNPTGTAEGGNFGGGHHLDQLYRGVQGAAMTILSDRDITSNMSPNLALVEDLLSNRIAPAVTTLGTFFHSRQPVLTRALRWVFRHKLEKIHRKYLSGDRTQAQFERVKSYRLMLLQMPG